jgi:Protein of unknown function (DUF998)
MNVPASDINTNPPGVAARRAASWAIVFSGAFITCLGALHLLKADVDPSWHFISEYELGAYGWLMQLAFALLAASCVAFAAALASQVRTLFGWIGIASLILSAIGMLMAAVFVTEPSNAMRIATTQHGRLHELGASLDGVPFAALLINWSLARNRGWEPSRRTLFWTAPLPLLGLLIFFGSLSRQLPPVGTLIGPGNLVGWPNRVLILAHCAWIIPVALRLRTRS